MAAPLNIPQRGALYAPTIIFDVEGLNNKDWGMYYSKCEFKAMMNGGYIVRLKLIDVQGVMLDELIKAGYLDKSRSQYLPVRFQLKSASDGKFPNTATRMQRAVVVSSNATGTTKNNRLEFVAIDPASWFLNNGDASGGVYTGKVSRVIRDVITQYAPVIDLEISETVDNAKNKFWMNRMDPKTFVGSLIEWAASVTRNKTNFMIGMDGNRLIIKEQAELISKPRAYYRFWKGTNDTILSWKASSNNALSTVQTKILTQGASAISGQYLDRITDEKEKKVFVKDSTTQNKQVAKTTKKNAFAKPDDSPGSGPQRIGWTSVHGIPEAYSAGEIGLPYENYIDGNARVTWLTLANSLMRIKVRVMGHGEWSDSIGLGTDTVYLKFAKEPFFPGETRYIYNGNWIIYGFNHLYQRGSWWTDLYLCRHDHDSLAKKVGGPPKTGA